MTEFLDLKTIFLACVILLLITLLIIKIVRKPYGNFKKLQEYKDKIATCNKLLKDFEKIKNEKNTIEKEKKQLIEKYNAIQKQLTEKNAIHRVQIDNINKETEEKIRKKNQEFTAKLKEIEEENRANAVILEKVRKSDILKDYAGKVVDSLDFCENILKIANEKIGKSDVETAKIISILLQQALLKTSEIAKWKQICGDIINTGVIVLNSDIKNCFQSNNETEQLNAFKKQCISKLRVFINSVLILCETFKNLSKFIENKDVAHIENEFKNKIIEIKNKAKEVGIIEIAEVKIFTGIDNNSNVESGNEPPSFPYSIVNNLNQDDIVEVILYGMKTEFDDMTETKVLIK